MFACKLLQQIDNFRRHSSEILARVELYPDEARELIANYDLCNATGELILKYIDGLKKPRIHFKSKKVEYYIDLANDRIEISKYNKESGRFEITAVADFSASEKKRFSLERMNALKSRLINKNIRYERWLELKDFFKKLIINYQGQPYKLFQLLVDMEVFRTYSRSYLQPISKTPYNDDHYFPDGIRILKDFIKGATRSDNAMINWKLWLINEAASLSKEKGNRTLAERKINIYDDVQFGKVYQIPTRYYKVRANGEYVLTKSKMNTPELKVVRQQMHILESLAYYDEDVRKMIKELPGLLKELKELNYKKKDKKYYRMIEEKVIIILESLVFYKENLKNSRSKNKLDAREGFEELINLFYDYILHRNIKPENVRRILRRQQNILICLEDHSKKLKTQYGAIEDRRNYFTKKQLREAKNIISGKNAKVDLDKAFVVLNAAASGYSNELTLKEKARGINKEFEMLLKHLKVLMSLSCSLKEDTQTHEMSDSYNKIINESRRIVLTKINQILARL